MAQWRRITRWNIPQIYRRFETMRTAKIKESEDERTREVGWWWKNEKRRKRTRKEDFLEPRAPKLTNHTPRLESSLALSEPRFALSGRSTGLVILQIFRPNVSQGPRCARQRGHEVYARTLTDHRVTRPRLNPSQRKPAGNK